MRIQVNSRRGHFNFANPSEESVSTAITIFEGEKALKSCSISTRDEVDSNDPDDLKLEIEEWLSRILYSSSMAKAKETAKFLDENADELRKGNKEFELEQLRKQREEIDREIIKLEAKIRD